MSDQPVGSKQGEKPPGAPPQPPDPPTQPVGPVQSSPFDKPRLDKLPLSREPEQTHRLDLSDES
jgi:hypothetical protein